MRSVTPLERETTAQRHSRAPLFLALGLACALRLVAAATASLHLDDLHSLHHARAKDWPTFFRVLTEDNHPPLSFALLRGVRAVAGEGLLALRLPALLCGLWLVVLAWRLAGHASSSVRVRGAAALFVACSSLAVEGARDLRMYALLAVAVAGTVEALLRVLRGPGRSLLAGGVPALAAYVWVGLHTHYHFLHALVVLGLATILCLILRPELRARWRALAAGVSVALVAALPWYWLGFRTQLGHGLAPGGSSVSPLRLTESYVHLLTHETRVAPPALHGLLLACGALGAALALLGWLRLARRRGLEPLTLCLAASAFVLPAWSALVAWLVPRAGYEWRYVVGALAPFAACFAYGAFESGTLERSRRVLGASALVGALALAALHALDPGRENYRDAVRWICERAGPADAVIAADWQPALFPHSGAWLYYAPRLCPAERMPQLIDHQDDFSLAPDCGLERFERVFVLLRSIPDGVGLLRSLRERYALEEKTLWGEAIWVLAFSEPRALTGG